MEGDHRAPFLLLHTMNVATHLAPGDHVLAIWQALNKGFPGFCMYSIPVIRLKRKSGCHFNDWKIVKWQLPFLYCWLNIRIEDCKKKHEPAGKMTFSCDDFQGVRKDVVWR